MQQKFIDALKREEETVQGLAAARRVRVDAWRQLKRELGPQGQEMDPIIGHRRVDAMIAGRMLALGLQPLLEVGTAGGVIGPEWLAKIEEQVNRTRPPVADIDERAGTVLGSTPDAAA